MQEREREGGERGGGKEKRGRGEGQVVQKPRDN